MSVSTLVLLGLAVVWASVLLPEGLKKLSGVRNGDSIRSFNHQLSSLQRSGGRHHASAGGSTLRGAASNVIDMRSRAERPAASTRPASPAVRRRRQEVLTVLGSATALTLLCSVAFGGPFLLLFLLAAGLLVTYLGLLYQVWTSPSAGALAVIGASPVSTRRIAN